MSDSSATPRPATLCVHSGTHLDSATGGVSSPVFTASAYAHPSPSGENIYPRYFNVPNQRVVARKVADLEGGEDALVFASGMGAIATVLLALLKPGDHAVFQADLYGGTHHLIRHGLQTRGIEVDFARGLDEFRNAMRATTRVVYVESPSNPLLRCVDLAAVASLAKSKGAVSVIDNTFATPINQRPISLGFDVVVHSATKYLNGHSDLNAGVAVASASLISMFRESAMDLGASLDPRVCYLLERGLKTLALRVRQHNENALALATFLERRPEVAQVHYPGLASHPEHAIAAAQMSGFGGMLSFELRDPNRVQPVLRSMKLVTQALSLGGVETLACVPALTSHVKMPPEERRAAGISDGLIRVSTGVEAIEDILADFDQALGAGA